MPPRSPLKSIRSFCVWCMGGNALEVKNCTAPACPLYPYRLGRNPYRSPPSEAKREAGRRAMARLRSRTQSSKKAPNSDD
jgi:hypothetical protein